MLRILSSLIVAAGLIFAATTAAHADPISALILGFLGISATSTAIGITTFILSLAASAGLSYLAKALAPKPSMPDISSLPGGTTGKLQAGGAVPRAFGVGRYMTAGSLAYANTYSPTAASAAAGALVSPFAGTGNTPNAYLVQVIPLSDIPVTGLVGLFVNGTAATYNSATPAVFEGIPIPEYNKSGKDHLWVRFYDGTQTTADAALVELFGTDPDRPYTSARIGTGVAYAVVTALVNQDLFPGFPQFKFVLDGVKLYDRRYDTTAGGSGSQRWATPSTWAVTGNPIVIAENILRGISYGGSWVYGAQTVAAAQLPAASWMAAASECDTAIDLAAGGTEVQFKAGGEIRFDVEPANTLEELLKACNGRLAEVGGTYKVRAGAAGSAVFSFTDGDILSTEQQTFEPFPGLGQTINAVTAKYISPAEGWVAKDAPPLYDATLETADGGRRQPVDINYSFVTSGTQVQRLMRSERDNHRAMRGHGLPMPPEAFVLEPLDVVSWTSTRNGYVSKLFEIGSAEDLPNLNMGLAIKELDQNAYDWVAGDDEQPIVDGTIVIVPTPSQSVVDWGAVPWTVVSDGDQALAAIKLSWDATSQDVSGVSFEVRRTSSGEVVHRSATDNYLAGSIIISQNLIFNTAYQVRGKYVPISARETSWSGWLSVTTPDDRIAVTSFNDALHDYVVTQLTDQAAEIDRWTQKIASFAVEQDAHNALDRYKAKVSLKGIEVDLAATDARVDVISQQQITDELAFASYQVSVAAQFTSVSGNISTAVAGAVATSEAYADHAVSTYAVTANATFATQSSLSSGLAGAIATSESYADSAIAAYAITVNATFATQTALTNSAASTLALAETYADHAVSVLNSTVQATYSTQGQTSAAIANVLNAAESYADHAVSVYDASVQATYSTQTATATAKNEAINAAAAYADGAISNYDQSVYASVGGFRAQVAISATAIATLDGYVAAAWGVKLNSNGYVSGIQLVNGGSGTSAFQISADVFQVAWPAVSGGSPVPIFQIANVNGTAKIVFRGDMYADGAITARSLSVAQLSAITADLGTVTAGMIKSTDNLFQIDLDNRRILIDDGT